MSGSPTSGIFSIHANTSENLVIVGGDYQKQNESSANFATSNDSGRTWIPGAQLPGYRSGIDGGVSEAGHVQVAVGPSGTDYRIAGGQWISIGSVGYDAVSFLAGRAKGWAVGQNGRIARWYER